MRIIMNIFDKTYYHKYEIFTDGKMILEKEEECKDKVNFLVKELAELADKKGGMFVERLLASNNYRIEIWENHDEILEKIKTSINDKTFNKSNVKPFRYYIDVDDCFAVETIMFYKIEPKTVDTLCKRYPASKKQLFAFARLIRENWQWRVYFLNKEIIHELVDFVQLPNSKYILKKMLQFKKFKSMVKDGVISIMFHSSESGKCKRALSIRHNNNVIWVVVDSIIEPSFITDEFDYTDFIKYNDHEWFAEISSNQIEKLSSKVISIAKGVKK